jgi:uncharacterized repeat protein (TIGR03803 family)
MKKLLAISFLILGSSAFTLCKAQLADIYNFTGANGYAPYSTFTRVGKVLYGTTNLGGANGYGCIYSIDTNGTGYKDLHDFNYTMGAEPDASGSVTLSGGLLFGSTAGGGTNGSGVVFSMDTNGSKFKVIHYFDSLDGYHPQIDVLLAGRTLYGTTSGGSIHGDGNIFSVDTSGSKFKDMLDFNGTNGRFSWGDLILIRNKLYGMTVNGGTTDSGVVFSIDTNGGNFNVLHNFVGPNDAFPWDGLAYSGKALYGTTSGTGTGNNSGSIFTIDTDGTGYRVMHNFNGAAGAQPYGSVTLSGKTLYGMTEEGGANTEGCIFSIDSNGSRFMDLHDFGGTDGINPFGGLLVSGNILYGVTGYGGVVDSGNVFAFKDTVTTGISELKATTGIVNIYPNPNNGNFTVALSHAEFVSSVTAGKTIEIYNVLGEQVYSQFNIQNPTFNINLSGQLNGIYLYRIKSNSGELIGEGKIVIQK